MSNGQTFNPREHLINIKNGKGVSEYLEVKWRLVWFRQECPQGVITTEVLHLDLDKDVEAEAFAWNAEKRRSEKVIKTGKGVAVFRATVTDGKGGSATGTKSENAANFPDFIEKAESGSIGRALAALGYGTQFAPEFNEEHRIVDSPVTREQETPVTNGTSQATGNPQRPNNGIHTPAQPEQPPTPVTKGTPQASDNKQPQHPTSGVSAPLPKDLRKRCDSLFGPGKWDAVVTRVLKASVPTDNMTPEDCALLKQALDNAERNRQQPQQKQAS